MLPHYETRAQYLAACTERTECSHQPPAHPYTWQCADCGVCRLPTDPAAHTRTDLICYPCAHARDVAELRDRSRPFVGYISSDGATLTTWPGGILGRVTSQSSYRGGFWGSRLHCYRVRDVHGAEWFGRSSGPGMAIRLRPCRTQGS